MSVVTGAHPTRITESQLQDLFLYFAANFRKEKVTSSLSGPWPPVFSAHASASVLCVLTRYTLRPPCRRFEQEAIEHFQGH